MDYRQITKNFIDELVQADKGQKNSLAYIKNALAETSLVKKSERFQIFVVGGTNFRKAVGFSSGDGISIDSIESVEQPSFRTQEKLFSFLYKHLLPKIRVIALNFAYPISPKRILRHVDGVLIQGTKENVFEGLVGNLIGESFAAYVYEKRKQRVIVSVANDTVCLLLSGTTKYTPETLACGVIGTGVNLAFFKDNQTIINLESGNFSNFPQTESGKYIDSHSQTKGKQLFEKEVSGAYLFAHFNYVLRNRNEKFMPLKGSEELDQIILKKEQHSDIAEEILNRSACLAACEIAGLMEFRKQSLTFVMQGSLFLKGQRYKETVEDMCKTLSPMYSPTFGHIEDADLIGAAKLIS